MHNCTIYTGKYELIKYYRKCIKFCGLNFRVFGWQENLWGINFCGHGGVVGKIVVGINYCGV